MRLTRPGARPRAGRRAALLVAAACGIGAGVISAPARAASPGVWVASWTASAEAPVPVPAAGNPAGTGFTDQTVRNIVFSSIGGDAVRVHLSNRFGTSPLRVGHATVGTSGGAAALQPAAPLALTFGGQAAVTIPVGAEVVSDPVPLAVPALGELAVSVYLPGPTGPATFHATSQETNYVATGDHAADVDGGSYAPLPAAPGSGTSWFYLSEVDVRASEASAGTVVAFGDSITDGYRSTVGVNHRWPNLLAARLVAAYGTRAPAVVDAGISGNRVLQASPCAGQSALDRFQANALSVAGVRAVILAEGINDILISGEPVSFCVPFNPPVSAADLIGAYTRMAAAAHARGIAVFGATLTPAGLAPGSAAEATRQQVNAWIRDSGVFDGVIDFDAVLRDPAHPARLNPAFDSGDHLHPNDAGYQAMADAASLAPLP